MKRRTIIFMGLFAIGMAVFGSVSHTAGQSGAEWITLLDGPNGLDNWTRVGTANWEVVDGIVQATASDKDAGYLVSKKAYQDFMLRIEFWVSDDANSGIFIRCTDPHQISAKSCYEANIYDTRPDPSYGTGAIVDVAKVSPMPKAGGKWNTYEITAKGPSLTLMLNGAVTVSAEDSKLASGPFALQWGKGVVKFRKVQIKPF
jgi:Domain of Unknown Function (DUF1080)